MKFFRLTLLRSLAHSSSMGLTQKMKNFGDMKTVSPCSHEILSVMLILVVALFVVIVGLASALSEYT